MKEILAAQGITKNFGGVHALKGVDFHLMEGEIHTLVGENGAGKSTLMKIFMGDHQPDSGQILFNGEPVKIANPTKALELGIAMVPQELHYMPHLSIADYVCVGREPNRLGFTNKRKTIDFTKQQLARIGFDIDPSIKMGRLTVSQIQLIEIAKVVSYGSKVLILDEPTSSLTVQEADTLFKVLCQLRSEGVSVIYISHKLDELKQITDRVTILRDGNWILTDKFENLTHDELVRNMIGRELNEVFQPKNRNYGEIALEAEGLTKKGVFENISLQVRRGEVVGLSGLVGAGRTEVVTSIFGEDKLDSGTVRLFGRPVHFKSARDAIDHKLAFVSEDRKLYGLNLIGSIRDNMTSASDQLYSRLGFTSKKKQIAASERMVSDLSIKIHSLEQPVNNLSGGNQQKVVLGKWLLTEPEIIIFDEPTRGIDVGAKSEFYRIIVELARAGKAVLMISSEMPEIIGLCNRVYVLHEGHFRGELKDTQESNDITEQNIVNLFF